MQPVLALKVDVDTERGTRVGVPALLEMLEEFSVPACFLFSLGPDNTGKAIRRVFRKGFLRKVSRTNVLQVYGLRTLLNGTLLPAPHVGQKHAATMRLVRDAGHETGIHCHDHIRWQDHLHAMSLAETDIEFLRAREEYRRVFGEEARCAGAAGWQANANSKQAYDEAGLLYASDTRGDAPFFPRVGTTVFRTLEIPTTLPTFDELLGRPGFPVDQIVPHYLSLLRADVPNVFTLHAEIEGMAWRHLFHDLLAAWRQAGVRLVRMDSLAASLLANPGPIPVRDLVMAEIDGRSGTVAAPEFSAQPFPFGA